MTLAIGKSSVEMSISTACIPAPSCFFSLRSLLSTTRSHPVIGFRDFQHVWIGHWDKSSALGIWSKPLDSKTPRGLMRLSQHGGHDITFSGDGETVFWLFGTYLHHASVKDLMRKCDGASIFSRDSGACVQPLTQSHEIFATYKTDRAQINEQAGGQAVVLKNSTLISMNPSSPKVVGGSTIVLQGGVITEVGKDGKITIPPNAYEMNISGGAVLPGFVDVHGHWGGFLSQYPSVSWELESFLGYGVTTIHNPSSKNVGGYAERALVEKGAFYGPRVYHTGDVLYGSDRPDCYTEINSLQDAYDALLRIKIEGGNSSFSVKNYQLQSRSGRQRLLLEAAKLEMLIVPEGGWSLDWDITYIIDGITTLEHPIPIPSLYDDILSLIAFSGSSYSQVAVMNYGGLFGQNWIHQNNDIPENEKLRKYVKHSILESLTEVKQAPEHSYQFFNSSISARKLAERGVRTNIGAHGEQPIGFLFHSEMLMHAVGGQSKYDVLKSATIDGATSLGLNSSVGSIEKGKLADLVIYPPEVDTIDKVWEVSKDMKYVVRGGRIFEVEDGLVEFWPRKGRRAQRGRINPEDEL